MRIIIVGGEEKADFLIGSLLKQKHKLTIINKDENVCKFFAQKYQLDIFKGDANKYEVLEGANVTNADILVALTPVDAENFTICKMAKELFGIEKTVASVKNPKNVEIYESLGVTKAISATYEVSNILAKATLIDNLESSLDIAEGKVTLSEFSITKDSVVCNKALADIDSDDLVVCAIIRNGEVVIPKGKTVILEDDTLIVLCPPKSLVKISSLIVGDDNE
ncbi:MAG: TrkA family potassium uptake protein [Erysipelotrichaceae bacterium]|nr:TrkA family potassium uptake protein [Erysipelotrichaceae bacterium]